ncbi:MAG: hypothetical protein HN904_00290 [Victivallales bacterium]|jgi:hypothetical protein|nr:hypothetical protein [Victivallales bacterium]MBT7161177.1 hypothetical protein [Victivallales bacterium]
MKLQGREAILWGVAFLGLALLFHFRFFWAEDEEHEAVYVYGQLASAGVLILGFGGMLTSLIWGLVK